MKKTLLSIAVLATTAMNAQIFFPSGMILAPTWSYEDVVGQNGGNFTNALTGNSGSVIVDATMDYTTFLNGDAYDGAFETFVNTTDSVYSETGLASSLVDTTGTTITLAEQLINGLYISKQYFFSTTYAVVRANIIVRNPSAAPIATKVGIISNLGSDGATIMDTSSTNGASLVDADRWMITWDQGVDPDPIHTWVRFGPGTINATPVFGDKPELSNGNYSDTLSITVPANSYSIILQFNRMDTTIAAARANVGTFNTVATMQALGYFSGMNGVQLSRVVNWDLSSLYAGINESYNTVNDVTISPNPSKGLFSVKLNTTSKIIVTNLTGQVVYTNEGVEGVHVIDIQDRANGVYLVKVITENSEHTQKLIKE